MRKHNGTQLYGMKRLVTDLKMGMNKELSSLSIKQKLAMKYVSKESKLTKIGNKIYANTFTPYFPSVAYDRFLKGVVVTTSGNPYPVVTNFAVTPQCPCNCWHCSFSDRSKKDILSLEQIKKAISEVQDLGVSVIGFTGGEPLLRNDLEEIIASVDERSMPVLFTTGYKLTKERVKRLKQAGLEIPVISLDHYTADVHDKGRRTQGIYDYALNAIKLFQDEGFYVAVSFVPDKDLVSNRAEIFKVIDFFKDLGINDMRLTSPILSGKLTTKPEEKLTPENVKTIFEIQKKCTKTKGYPGVFAYDFFESEQYYGCGAGYNYMFIDSQGNVCPCDFTMLSFGNIHERPIGDIWKETSQTFCKPGCSCYASLSNDFIFAKKSEEWPLKKQATIEILEECPSYDENKAPEFYKRMGCPGKKRKDPMGRQHIEIRQTFNAPVETIFNILTDHESFGNVIATKMQRVVDCRDENKNGVGSIRRISSFPLPAFEETVITFEPNFLMEYVISKGSPIKNHKGRMEFSEEGGKTKLCYFIDFDPRLPFILLGSVLKSAIEKPIRQSLEKLSKRYASQTIADTTVKTDFHSI